MRKSLLLALAFLSVFATYAQKDSKPRYTVSGGVLGAANIAELSKDYGTSNIDYASKFGVGFGAWVCFPMGPVFAFEPQVVFNSYNLKATSASVFSGRAHHVSIPLMLKLHAGKYFAFTAGPQLDFLSNIKNDATNTPQWTKSQFNKHGFSVLGGIELFPRGRVTIFGRYIYGTSKVYENDVPQPGGNSNYRLGNIQFGLKLKLFGKEKKMEMETPPPPAPKDTDGDGIYDDVDKCPTVPGIAKYNGCPIPDTDGDGINDEEDKCPTVPGVAKYNGCPPPDRDNDGVIDDEDKCPDVPGIKENQGCPAVSDEVKKTIDYAAKNVYFNTGKTTLLAKSHGPLDEVVKILNNNPNMKLKIDGHTDDVGSDESNMTLSEGRANAVKEYLVSKGISEDRLMSEGFGETMPIADNKTAAGRAKNRRVEMKVSY